MVTQEQRNRIVKEAKTWIGTPYRGWSQVKGAGADCGQILHAIYSETGFIPKDIPLPKDYRLDVAQHRASTGYVDIVSTYMDEIPEGEAREGDVVVYKFPKQHAFAHGAVIVKWRGPRDFDVIDAQVHGGVKVRHGYHQPKFDRAHKKYFTLKTESQKKDAMVVVTGVRWNAQAHG
jgi:hypothetical protein